MRGMMKAGGRLLAAILALLLVPAPGSAQEHVVSAADVHARLVASAAEREDAVRVMRGALATEAASVQGIGIVFVVITATLVVAMVEDEINVIWGIPQKRRLHRRFWFRRRRDNQLPGMSVLACWPNAAGSCLLRLAGTQEFSGHRYWSEAHTTWPVLRPRRR